jgi:hypothetical protein
MSVDFPCEFSAVLDILCTTAFTRSNSQQHKLLESATAAAAFILDVVDAARSKSVLFGSSTPAAAAP